MSFMAVLKTAMGAAAEDDASDQAIAYCAMCHTILTADQADALCEKCRREVAQGFAVRHLAGRCANGAERDSGTLFHALPIENGQVRGRALCGAAPRRRSVGWSEWGHGAAVTCPKCLKKLGQSHA